MEGGRDRILSTASGDKAWQNSPDFEPRCLLLLSAYTSKILKEQLCLTE